MGTGRFEAFSDGVFAIAATLLVLEFHAAPGDGLGKELLHLWPSYLAYVTSFVTIGIIWMNHHHAVSLLGRIDRTMLFLNILLLLTVAFLPFPTKLVAQNLRGGGEETAALAYTATFVLMSVIYNTWWRYASVGRRLVGPTSVVEGGPRGRRLVAEGVPDSALRGISRAFNPGVPMYAAAFVIAFFSPLTAVFLTFAIAAFYLPSAALFDR